MAEKRSRTRYARRDFLKGVAGGAAVGASLGVLAAGGQTGEPAAGQGATSATGKLASGSIEYPRTFTGRALKTVAFPLGGIGTGTVSLGGRGQLRDWELFNRPDKGNELSYAFPSIWVKVGESKPVARVLESRLQPPYEVNPSGLGSDSAPGLPRLAQATFTGAYPFARIAFADPKLPVKVGLEAFNPMAPLDVEASEWPVAILRYTVRNSNPEPARVGIAWSIENPVGDAGRQSQFRQAAGVTGLYMDNPFLSSIHALKGTFALCVLGAPEGTVTYLRGWKKSGWWDGVLTFWDDFSDDGALDPNSPSAMPIGSLAVTQTIPPGKDAVVTFLLAWRFPNRTPERCGWEAAEGVAKSTVVGNAYCVRFADAWDVSQQIAEKLPALEARTRKFAEAIERSTLPPALLDATTSTLSTLRTNTCFRTADGEFHGFEGCFDNKGCCHGSCTHVWNYEHATWQLYPRLAHSLRESEFLRNTDTNGLMGFRSYLPDGKQIWQMAAADGQMGCLIKLYREWRLSGDTEWLRRLWPGAKRALEFAWIENGWDGNRDGVAEGVQHNTYDVEFYGPNPLCGIYYLGALRAGEEMARIVGDDAAAAEYHRVFESGSRWVDQNLFNGEYYIQKVQGHPDNEIAKGVRVGMGAGDPLHPSYQMGESCLADQLLGQLQAHVAGLGYLLAEAKVRTALKSVYKYNYRTDLSEHVDLQRTYALNDEGGVVIATYPLGKRPEIPFPYFGEIWTGMDYQFAASLAFEGMMTEALNVIESTRRRFDGERRNPWNEPECGHHYARAMASWACFAAWSGFKYSASSREVTMIPRTRRQSFRCFWAVPTGWGSYTHTFKPQAQTAELMVSEGSIAVQHVAVNGVGKAQFSKVSARLGSNAVSATLKTEAARRVISLDREVSVTPEAALQVALS